MSDETVFKAEEAREMTHPFPWTAVFLIVSGALMLLANLLHVHLIEFLWPGFIIAPGLLMLRPAYKATAEDDGPLPFFAVPGAVFVTVGLLLFAMGLTGYYEAWAYSWPLVFAAAAAGLMYSMRFQPESGVHKWGYRFVRLMVFTFLGMVFLFELFLFDTFNPLLPLLMIGYGIYLAAKNRPPAKSVS